MYYCRPFPPEIRHGFTLIELLVVISILGVLAAVVLVAINPAVRLASARDAQRKTDLAQIATALESFYTMNGYYPITSGGVESDFNSAESWWNQTNFLPASELKRLPVDPKNGELNKYWYYYAYYYYSPNGQDYELATFLENESDSALIEDKGNQPSALCGVEVYEVGTDKSLIRLLGC